MQIGCEEAWSAWGGGRACLPSYRLALRSDAALGWGWYNEEVSNPSYRRFRRGKYIGADQPACRTTEQPDELAPPHNVSPVPKPVFSLGRGYHVPAARHRQIGPAQG